MIHNPIRQAWQYSTDNRDLLSKAGQYNIDNRDLLSKAYWKVFERVVFERVVMMHETAVAGNRLHEIVVVVR